jgi:hypothetical protein
LDLETSIKKYENTVRAYNLLYAVLDFAIVFFTLHIVFSLLNMKDIFSIISIFEPYTGIKYNFLGFKILFETLGIIIVELTLTVIITFIRYTLKEKKDAIKLIEEKYPALKERLRTAYDNRNTDNIIVKDLVGRVIIDLKPVEPLSLLNKKLFAIGIGLTLLMGLCAIFIASSDYHTDITPSKIPEVIAPYVPGSNANTYPVAENGGTSNNESSNEGLFGKPEVIVVEGKPVDFKIPPGSGQGFTSQEEENKTTNESFIQSDTVNPEAVASQVYYENLPEGYKNVIQSYFEELAKD